MGADHPFSEIKLRGWSVQDLKNLIAEKNFEQESYEGERVWGEESERNAGLWERDKRRRRYSGGTTVKPERL